MEQEEKNMQESAEAEKSFSFLSSIRKGQDITVRDDLFDFQLLLDAAKLSRRMGISFRVVDSGSLETVQIEWLAAEGAIVYTSDDAKREVDSLRLINKACQRGKSFLACFHNGPLNKESESAVDDWESLAGLGDEGAFVFLSNRKYEREAIELVDLADHCRRGGSWLVYYHHGDLQVSLAELARNGAWIHVEDSCLKGNAELSLLLDVIRESHSAGTNCVFHLESEMEYYLLKDIQKAGAVILFKSKLIDYRSPLKSLQEQAAHTKLEARAYYLYSSFFF